MPEPQAGIFDESNLFHHHLEYRLNELELASGLILDAKQAASGVLGSNGRIVVGVRPSFWSKLNPKFAPEDCQDFRSIHGATGLSATATQNDVWFWLHSDSHDRNLDSGLKLDEQLRGSARLEVDVASFVRHEKRDLTGFIDGTANPKGEAIQAAALIAGGQPGAGGSLALTQRWVHDLAAFEALSVPDQEAVIGRTKIESIELEGETMPSDSHVSRTDVKIDEVALKIYRRSTPYGTVGEHGLFFVAFACERRRLQIQLERMFGVWTDELHDRLIHYSRAVTGSYWFVPSEEDLARISHNDDGRGAR